MADHNVVFHDEILEGGSNNGASSGIWSKRATVTTGAVGRFDVVFDTAMPNDEYHISLSVSEPTATRDDVNIWWHSKSANGFSIYTGISDNGGGAAVYFPAPWSFSVMRTA